MTKNLVCANMMIRNEPFAVYGLSSIIDYVDAALVVDTGSDDGTFEEMQALTSEYPNKITLMQEKVVNCHDWKIQGHEVKTNISELGAKQLGNIRRSMHAASNSEFVWVIDGDEIYFKGLSSFVRESLEQIVKEKIEDVHAMFLPFVDYIDKVGKVRQYHHMGRLFRKDAVEIRGDYPHEMHWGKHTNIMYEPHSTHVAKVDTNEIPRMVQHLECIIKPNRKDHRVIDTVLDVYPEVINRLIDRFPRIKQYVER